MKVLHAPHAWLADGWQSDVRIAIDTGGTIRSVSRGAAQSDDERLAGPLLPGSDVRVRADVQALGPCTGQRQNASRRANS